MFFEFVKAWLSQWKPIITGATVFLIFFVVDLTQRWWQPPLYLYLIVAIVCGFSAHFLAWRKERHEVLQLRERLAPRLEMRFLDNIPPYCDVRSLQPYRIYRVGVRNAGGTSVDNVEAKVTDIDPPVCTFIPLPLGAMHGLHGPLNPGDERFFDVIDNAHVSGMRLLHAVPGHAPLTPAVSCTLTLTAYGGNVIPCVAKLAVDLGSPSIAGTLRFHPA